MSSVAAAGEGVASRLASGLTPQVRGLLYKEWLAHRGLVVNFWAWWLVGQVVLLIFMHPAWIFGFGLLYAVLGAPAFAGIDAAEGSEEFAFSLPPVRGQIYVTRLVLGGGNLVLMLLAGLMCIRANVPQMLWGIVVESGFTEPFPPAEGVWYAFAAAAPVALFAFGFVFAALAQSRGAVGVSWFLGALVGGAIAGGGLICEWLIWKRVTGAISCPALAALAAVALLSGYQLYLRKEGVSRPTPVAGGQRRLWVWLVIAGIFLVLIALMWFARAVPTRAGARNIMVSPPMIERVHQSATGLPTPEVFPPMIESVHQSAPEVPTASEPAPATRDSGGDPPETDTRPAPEGE